MEGLNMAQVDQKVEVLLQMDSKYTNYYWCTYRYGKDVSEAVRGRHNLFLSVVL